MHIFVKFSRNATHSVNDPLGSAASALHVLKQVSKLFSTLIFLRLPFMRVGQRCAPDPNDTTYVTFPTTWRKFFRTFRNTFRGSSSESQTSVVVPTDNTTCVRLLSCMSNTSDYPLYGLLEVCKRKSRQDFFLVGSMTNTERF